MKTTVIGVAGGTGSGKSTLTNRLKGRFGDRITVIYHDNYYKRHDDIPFEERVHLNYDAPESLETDLLAEHLKMLREGKSVECPVYDFSVHNRTDRTVTIEPSPIIIVEGILVLSAEELADELDIKIFVDADADERILRRAERDMKERGRDLHGIIDQYLTTVKPMHYKYVEPAKQRADIVCNSGWNDVAFDMISLKIEKLLSESVS